MDEDARERLIADHRRLTGWLLPQSKREIPGFAAFLLGGVIALVIGWNWLAAFGLATAACAAVEIPLAHAMHRRPFGGSQEQAPRQGGAS